MILHDDLQMLIALQDNPLGTYRELANVLGIAISTVKVRLENLSEKLDSKPDSNVPTIRVRAHLNLPALDLTIVNALVWTTSLDTVLDIEKVLYRHPYTIYHARCLGRKQGLFIQFQAPREALPKIQRLFSSIQLTKPSLIEDFCLLPASEISVYTNFDLEAWNESQKAWIFDWPSWFSQFDSMSPEFPQPISSCSESILGDLSRLDLQILQELTWNARRKNKDLIEILKTNYSTKTDINPIEPYQMTRRLKYLNERAISDYQVAPNWRLFNIFDSLLFVCRTTRDISHKMANLLQRHPIPFKSIFRVLSTGFIWFINCPSSQFSEISEIIWRRTPDFDLYLLDYRSSRLYEFWWETFDIESKTWRIDDDFMINDPLKELK